jgi:phage shock protein A
MEQGGLFENDPAVRPRDKKGRFATPLRAYADKAIEENKVLKFQVEKYKRAWIAVSNHAHRVERELAELRQKIALL